MKKEEEFLKEYWLVENNMVTITLNDNTYATIPLAHLNLKSIPDYAIKNFMNILADSELYEYAIKVRDEIKLRKL